MGVTLLLTAVLLVVAGAEEETAAATKEDYASRPREGRLELEPHPLYANLQKENRRLLDEAEDEIPNYVDDVGREEVIDYGDSVDGYNLPDSYSSAPSYADPSLLSAVMSQADKANFKFPLRTTVPPATDQSASGSEVDQSLSRPESNEINPFILFPTQFHDLLEIPLHTYANGSTFSPHDREQIRPFRPLIISKGYANMKIQGGNKVRNKGDQGTPQVAYSPQPVFGDDSDITGAQSETPSTTVPRTTSTSTSTTSTTSTTTTTTTTRPSTTTTGTTTTTSTTTTSTPRRKTYESPPPRVPTSPVTSRRPIINSRPTITNSPYRPPSPPTHDSQDFQFLQYDQAKIDDVKEDTRAKIPGNLPPLRYTRRPTTEYPTSYFTTPRPVATRPTTPRPTPSQSYTTKESDYSYETVGTTKHPAYLPVHRDEPYGTKIPSRIPSLAPTKIIESKPHSQFHSRPTATQPSSAVQPQASKSDEDERFRPSKTDPFMKPRPAVATYQPGNIPAFSSEVLPPVVNTYEVTTRLPSPQQNAVNRPGPLDIPTFVPPKQSLPPPPRLPSRPVLSLPPLPAGRPSLPPPPPVQQSTNIPYKPIALLPQSDPSAVRPPLPPRIAERPPLPPRIAERPPLPPRIAERPPLPPRIAERPILSPPPLPPPKELSNNDIFKPEPPTPFARPPLKRPTDSPSSFGPPRPSSIYRPRPGATFSSPVPPQRNPRPVPNRPLPRPGPRPPFQIVRPVVTPPPPQQDIVEQPDPRFNLPAEANNLPKRRNQNNELTAAELQNNAPNILPQFRPNAPPQRENFGLPDQVERIYNSQRPQRLEKRPVLTKRPSFLESFNFFRRSPVNRRRGETGPLTNTNSAAGKTPAKPNTLDKTAAIHYQLTHGALPKHAQKVVVIGPFKQPPPGAPVIPAPKKGLHPPAVYPPPPPPPGLPNRQVSPPPRTPQSDALQVLPISKKGFFDEASEQMSIQGPLRFTAKKPKENQAAPEKKESDIIYGQPLMISESSSAEQNMNSPPLAAQSHANKVEEVSEEHKEAIIAGKFHFPAVTGIDRSGAGNENTAHQNIIPVPVPILPQQQDSDQHISPVKWSIFGFNPAKPKPSATERIIAQPPRVQRPPSPPVRSNVLQQLPPRPTNLQYQRNYLRQQRPNSSPRIQVNEPAPFILPPPPANIDTPYGYSNDQIENITEKTRTSTTPPPTTTTIATTTVTTTTHPTVVTFIPYKSSTKYPPSTKPRPVYRHTTTTPKSQMTKKTTTTTTTERNMLKASTVKSTTVPTQEAITSQPVTPMRITEFNPYSGYTKKTEVKVGGSFQAPIIESTDYGGWKVVGVPPMPSEGPGDALSPVISYVKENTPDIIIKAPTKSSEGDVVTGTIIDRMGEVDDGDHLVKYSTNFNVETPGIVRSYWVEAPSLA